MQRPYRHDVARPPAGHVALGERVEAPGAGAIEERLQRLVPHHRGEHGQELAAPLRLGSGEEGAEPVGRRERREDPLALDPHRGPDPVRGGAADVPERARVGDDGLGGERVALAVEGGEPPVRDARDRHVAQRAGGECAYDRLRLDAFAVAQEDRAAARGHAESHDDAAEPHPLAEVGGHPQRDSSRALGHAQVLPAALVVEPVRAGGRLLGGLGETGGTPSSPRSARRRRAGALRQLALRRRADRGDDGVPARLAHSRKEAAAGAHGF